MGTIKINPKAIVKDKPSNMAVPKAKMPAGLGVINAVENKEGQDSGFKKKRLHKVEALKYPK